MLNCTLPRRTFLSYSISDCTVDFETLLPPVENGNKKLIQYMRLTCLSSNDLNNINTLTNIKIKRMGMIVKTYASYAASLSQKSDLTC